MDINRPKRLLGLPAEDGQRDLSLSAESVASARGVALQVPVPMGWHKNDGAVQEGWRCRYVVVVEVMMCFMLDELDDDGRCVCLICRLLLLLRPPHSIGQSIDSPSTEDHVTSAGIETLAGT